jgi:hypothetical protein
LLTVGVTGHRYLTDVDRIAAGVDQALGRIEAAFRVAPSRVISALAEGADRLVVLRMLARSDVQLTVPLPFPRSEYVRDFRTPESRDEFLRLLARADEVVALGPRSTRDEAYRAAGRYVLDHSDVLIAVWDGQPAQGVGGTGHIVAEARRRHLPLAWVHAGNRTPGTQESTTLGHEQGAVTLERLPVPVEPE